MRVQILPREGAILKGKGRPTVKYRDYRSCAAAMRPFCEITLTNCSLCLCVCVCVSVCPFEQNELT